METPATPAFDLLRKRPLELRVRDLTPEGGICEADAQRRDMLSADAVVLTRFLVEDSGEMKIELASLYGASGEPLALDGLFGAWLAFTGHLARQAEGSDVRKANFLRHILKLHMLDTNMNVIQNAETPGVAHLTPETSSPTPAASHVPEGADPASLG